MLDAPVKNWTEESDKKSNVSTFKNIFEEARERAGLADGTSNYDIHLSRLQRTAHVSFSRSIVSLVMSMLRAKF